jgi:hypothetical protein
MMAIIKRLGLAVSVIVDGEALPEYDDPEPDAKGTGNYDPAVTAICNKYIEAKDSTEYSVRCEVLPEQKWPSTHRDNVITFKVFIDGQRCRSTALFQGRDIKAGYGKFDAKGAQYSGSTGDMLRKFKFGNITTS